MIRDFQKMFSPKKFLSSLLCFLKQRTFAEYYILIFLSVAVFSTMIANEKPLLRIADGSISFPFLSPDRAQDNLKSNSGFSIGAPVPYSPGITDAFNADFKGPFDKQFYRNDSGVLDDLPWYRRHWLGTNMRGADLLSQIIYGTRISFFIALTGTVFSFIIGAVLGCIAGWYGPGKSKVPVLLILAVIVFVFLEVHVNTNFYAGKDQFFANIFLLFVILSFMIFIIKSEGAAIMKFRVLISFDGIIQRFSELFSAIPRFVFILAIVQLFEPSYGSVIFILAISGWVEISRILRSEIQRMKNLDFVEAARLSGVQGIRLFTNQLLPNLWPSLIVVLLYSFAGNIAIEASLSFLGFGLPADVVTLGSLVASGKSYFEAWWLVVFPGLWISGFIYSLFSVSRRLRTNQLNYIK